MPKTLYRLIVVGLVLGSLLFAGLYVSERFRSARAFDDAEKLRALNGELIANNGRLGNQLDEARSTVDRIERDKRALDAELASVRGELGKSRGESERLRKQLSDAKATVGQLTSGSEETRRIVEEFRGANRQFRAILEKYAVPASSDEVGGDSSGDSGAY